MLQSIRVRSVKLLIDINEYFIFEKRLRKAYKALMGNKIGTIIDVGANKGQSIDFFKKMDPNCTIFAFEPNKELYHKLRSKYNHDPAIKILNLGVTDSLGQKKFHQNVLDYTSTFETINVDSAYLQRKARILGVNPENVVTASYDVETTTLSHFINKEVSTTIDVLKIDVEGHEYPCLIGLFNEKLSSKIRYIQVEKHNDDMYMERISFDDVRKLLNENGFNVQTTIKHGFGNLEEVIFYNTHLEALINY